MVENVQYEQMRKKLLYGSLSGVVVLVAVVLIFIEYLSSIYILRNTENWIRFISFGVFLVAVYYGVYASLISTYILRYTTSTNIFVSILNLLFYVSAGLLSFFHKQKLLWDILLSLSIPSAIVFCLDTLKLFESPRRNNLMAFTLASFFVASINILLSFFLPKKYALLDLSPFLLLSLFAFLFFLIIAYKLYNFSFIEILKVINLMVGLFFIYVPNILQIYDYTVILEVLGFMVISYMYTDPYLLKYKLNFTRLVLINVILVGTVFIYQTWFLNPNVSENMITLGNLGILFLTSLVVFLFKLIVDNREIKVLRKVLSLIYQSPKIEKIKDLEDFVQLFLFSEIGLYKYKMIYLDMPSFILRSDGTKESLKISGSVLENIKNLKLESTLYTQKLLRSKTRGVKEDIEVLFSWFEGEEYVWVLPVFFRGELTLLLYMGFEGWEDKRLFDILEVELIKIVLNLFILVYKTLILEDSMSSLKLFEVELELGGQIQKLLFRSEPLYLEGYGVEKYMESAYELCGDFLESLAIENGGKKYLIVMVGDVSGKGLLASAISFYYKTIISEVSKKEIRPINIYKKLNLFLLKNPKIYEEGFFITFTIMVVDLQEDTVYLLNGGNPGVFVLKENGNIEILSTTLPPLGVSEKIIKDIPEITVKLKKGEKIILFTDGFTDMPVDEKGEKLLELEGVHRILSEIHAINPEMDIKEFKERLIDSIFKIRGNRALVDDLTIGILGKV